MSDHRKSTSFWKIFGASSAAMSLIMIVGFIILGAMTKFLIDSIGSDVRKSFDFSKTYDVEEGTILTLDLNQSITDRTYKKLNTFKLNVNSNLGILDLLKVISDAKTDDRVKGIYLKSGYANISLANAEELRSALEDFKTSGKFIYAYGDKYTQKCYHICSVADKVYLYPTGMIEFKGLSAQLSFYKDLLDKAHVEIQVIRGSNNQFKSAVEPFLRNSISEPNKKQTKRFLDGLWSVILEDISISRQIGIERLQTIADSLMVRDANDAVKVGLIDELLYTNSFKDLLHQKLELEDSEKVNLLSINHYRKRQGKYASLKSSVKLPDVAIIYASGSIAGGSSDEQSIGDKTLVKAINQAANNPYIKAIVLRVNSPGGDALASDLIWDALRDAKQEKPVIVSMGGVAASGGYYISCMADKIFADPTTITGSIGVFMVVPNTQKLFEEDLGIHSTRVKTAQHADMSYLEISMSAFTRPLTDVEKDILQEGVDDVYDDFLSRVVEGRSTFETIAEVDSIGQGRVWCGTDALKIGLVDTLGGLQDAIDYAALLVGIEHPKTMGYPLFETTGLSKLIQMVNGNSAQAQFNHVLDKAANIPLGLLEKLEQVTNYTEIGTMQARPFWDIEIK